MMREIYIPALSKGTRAKGPERVRVGSESEVGGGNGGDLRLRVRGLGFGVEGLSLDHKIPACRRTPKARAEKGLGLRV